MKSKTITTLVVEGTDGVGKTTLYKNLLDYYNYMYCVYDRGELSNIVYAEKYNRPFCSTQRGLPILYILLICNKSELKRRIIERAENEKWLAKDVNSELNKINDQDNFIKYYDSFKNDYHIIKIDCTNLNEKELLKLAVKEINNYVNNLSIDDNLSSWNELYKSGCEKLGLKFKCINNQPYINNVPIMAECNLHNGVYEMFDNKTIPHNLIYCQAYTQKEFMFDCDFSIVDFYDRKEDFSYIINSKIFSRRELFDYFKKFTENNISCITGDIFIDNPLIKRSPRVFGDDYIKKIGEAKATVYVARELAYLKYTTTRLYESILAKQIIFVDKLSDPKCIILNSIYKNSKHKNALISLLYVDENSICDNYKIILNDYNLVNEIIISQFNYYNELKASVLTNNLFIQSGDKNESN